VTAPVVRRHWRVRRADGTLVPCTEVTPEEWDHLRDSEREILHLGVGLGIVFVRLDRP